MTVLSCLRAPAIAGARAVFGSSIKPGQLSVVKGSMALRFMSAEKKMLITPSKHLFTVLKDHYHFYFLLGFIIWGTPMVYCYMRIGPAELRDIPEGYVPKDYEYVQNPIARWVQKTYEPSYEKMYEKNLSILYIKRHEQLARLLKKRVKQLMREKQDYEGWYYKPHNVSYVYSNEFEEEMRRRTRAEKT